MSAGISVLDTVLKTSIAKKCVGRVKCLLICYRAALTFLKSQASQ